MISKRNFLISSVGAAGALAMGCSPNAKTSPFVSVSGMQLLDQGKPYHFAGTNMWYGAYLGSAGAAGDRARLIGELNTLQSLGMKNIRLLASSEDSPLKNSVKPSFRTKDGPLNEELLVGLDFMLAEMGKRDMKAVLYLTNFWEWSGGMVTYLYWTNGGKFINNGDPAHPWPAFADFSSQFYASGEAVKLYHDYVRTIVTRTNTITGKPYADDPTIMTWQLCNEPRPGGGPEVAKANQAGYLTWISATAKLIKSLDANHLVSVGHEGLMGCVGDQQCVVDAHKFPEVDYLTAHIWPLNWGWVNDKDLAGTFPVAEANTRKYIADHIAIATELNKPLIIEEFGFPRDTGGYSTDLPTTFKDKFYGLIYGAVEESFAAKGPVAGSNFWAWGGAGRAQHPDFRMQVGDTIFVGDPPHEPQGWYSVFDGDATTIALIKAHAAKIGVLTS